jgi:hypothetical protein
MDPTTDPRIPRPDLERRIVEQESQIREMANERLRLLAQIVEAGDRADDAAAKLKSLREKARAVCEVVKGGPAFLVIDALRAEVES